MAFFQQARHDYNHSARRAKTAVNGTREPIPARGIILDSTGTASFIFAGDPDTTVPLDNLLAGVVYPFEVVEKVSGTAVVVLLF